MAALRCPLCGISYPYHGEFQPCPIHDVETTLLRDTDPDKNWKERAEAIAVRVAEDTVRPYPRVEGVETHEEHDLLWVSHADLLRAGFRPSVIGGGKVNGYPALFELNGFVYEIQGWDEPRRRWWIEQVAEAPQLIEIPGVK